MSPEVQQRLVLMCVGAVMLYWGQRLARPLWLGPVTRWLLRHGRVGWAMRLRFGKRRR